MIKHQVRTSIGITVDCEHRCIRWGGTEIPLKIRNTLNNDEILHMLYIMQQMNQVFCKKQKRGKIAYWMLIIAKLR
jgi:hypothetical protein